jgi:hypothetical protein
VLIFIVGGTISGYWLIGTLFKASNPTSTIIMDSTIATIGRRTKNSPISVGFVA